MIPRDVEAALERYVQDREPQGHFLHAVLANDLYRACARADDCNRTWLVEIAAYVEGRLPPACRGSDTAVRRWLARREVRCHECGCPWPCTNCVDAEPVTPDGKTLE